MRMLWCVYVQYSFNIIPLLGEKVANDRDSYQVRSLLVVETLVARDTLANW